MAGFSFLQLLALLVSLALASSGPTLPVKDDFYVPPEGFEAESPGTILRSRTPPNPISAFSTVPVNLAASYQLLYRTTDSFGKSIATVSTILIPNNADYSKLLSYQVAQDAADPNCSPSYAFQLEAAHDGVLGLVMPQLELILIAAALERGWIVTVPDHLGPESAYLANLLSGHAVLDNLRAALSSSDFTDISSDPTIALWGYSGGSLASGFAAELQPDYAPELKIAGAALGGTIPSIPHALQAINNSPFAGLIPAGIQGLAYQYRNVSDALNEYILPDKRAEFNKTQNMCLVGNTLEYIGLDVYDYTKDPSIFTIPKVSSVLDEIAMGHNIPQIPLLIYKSAGDEVSPVNDTDALYDTYCDVGVRLEYKRDDLSEHASLAALGAPDALLWLDDRFNGVPVEEDCSKSTELTSLLDPKALGVLGGAVVEALLTILGAPVGPTLIG